MDKSDKLISYLPRAVAFEIERICLSRKVDISAISEIRLRVNARSSVTLLGERIYLYSRVSREDMRSSFSLLLGGSLYSFRDGISDGYIMLDGGIRVGVAGRAGYDGGKLVGICEVGSLIFRIPTSDCELEDELFASFCRAKRGMLVYSPPGVGKTTALRSLARRIGSGKNSSQVAIIDERGEFAAVDYSSASVDILRGYRRPLGIEIALRTLSPDVILLDEIGGEEEAQRILEFMNSGVKILASAHADSFEALRARKALSAFFSADVFDVFVGISLQGGMRVAKTTLSEEFAT